MNKNLPCRLAIILLLCCGALAVRAQQRTVTGKVTDETQQALPGTNIIVKGTGLGTVSDADGNYSIDVTSDDQVLVFSFVGYTPEEVLVGQQSVINMMLLPDIATLSEVVVIGYGEQQRSDIVGAVSQINSKQIAEIPVTTLEQVLSGQVSGVQLRQTGQPGSGPEVLVRGISSITATNSPLYVVDGFPIGNVNNQNDNFILSSLSPNEIESITVLKDATSKAIYGSRASGGIVMIKTKRGKSGRPSITFSSSIGVQSIPDYEKPNNLNATELARFQRERIEDNIRVLQGREPVEEDIPAQYRNPEQYGQGTSWFDEITRNALMQDYNVSLEGGTDNVKYSLSLGHLNQNGTLLGTGFKRYSFRSNIDAKITDRIRFGLNIAPMHALRDSGPTEPGSEQFSVYGSITSSYWIDPSASIRNPDGSLASNTLGKLLPFYTASPVAEIYQTFNLQRTTQILMASYLDVDLAKGLTAKVTLSTFFTDRRIRGYRSGLLPGDGTTPNPKGSGNSQASITDLANQNVINENTITYKTAFNDNHSLTVLGGFTFETRESETTNVFAQNIIDDEFILPSSGNVSQENIGNFTGSAGFEENSLLSILGRVNYVYQDKYYLTAAFRRDGSSRFGAANRYANFPSVSGAWRISNESFFQNSTISEVINDLKLEAGFGIVGNNAIGNYQSQGSVGNANYVFGNTEQRGNAVTGVPNSLLTWEETEQLDIGFDIGLFSKKFNLSVDYYSALSKDFITNLPIPRTTGFGFILNNTGTLRNRGVEVEFNTTNLVDSDLKYDFGFNLTVNRNKVLEIDNTLYLGAAGNGTQFTVTRAGDPVGLFIGLQTLGLFTQEQIDDPSVPKYAGARTGSMNYVDGDGDGRLELFEDYVVIGNPHADFLFGMTHNMSYKNFDLRVVMAGAVGQQIFELRKEITKNFDGVFNLDREVFNRYRPGDDPTTKSVPTTVSGTNIWRAPNSNSVKDADYLFIRNITLGYNLSGKMVKNLFKRARIYSSIQNPFLFSEYKIGNPEINRATDGALVRNVNQGSYPISTIYSLGLNVTF
jgi:TonB-linked SusC/RagA family outer membrane protein